MCSKLEPAEPPPSEEQMSKESVSWLVSLIFFVISALAWNPKTSGGAMSGILFLMASINAECSEHLKGLKHSSLAKE